MYSMNRMQYMHFKHCIGADDDARKIPKYCVHNRSHFPHIEHSPCCGTQHQLPIVEPSGSPLCLKYFLKVLSELLIITIADHPDNDGVVDES